MKQREKERGRGKEKGEGNLWVYWEWCGLLKVQSPLPKDAHSITKSFLTHLKPFNQNKCKTVI